MLSQVEVGATPKHRFVSLVSFVLEDILEKRKRKMTTARHLLNDLLRKGAWQ